jgi:MFS family permease
LCILLIPFFLRRYGIKRVMIIAMLAWMMRFGFFGLGNPGSGVWLLVISMLVYGVAFDFFNVSGSLFVDKETPHNIRASAQGLFMLMTNGIGATIGTLGAQWVVNQFTSWQDVIVGGEIKSLMLGDWQSVWFIFAGYALLVAILFALLFRYRHEPEVSLK